MTKSPRIAANKGRIVKWYILPDGTVTVFSTNGKIYIEEERGSFISGGRMKEISKEDIVELLI